MLSHYIWLGSTGLGSTDIEHSHHHRKLHQTLGIYTMFSVNMHSMSAPRNEQHEFLLSRALWGIEAVNIGCYHYSSLSSWGGDGGAIPSRNNSLRPKIMVNSRREKFYFFKYWVNVSSKQKKKKKKGIMTDQLKIEDRQGLDLMGFVCHAYLVGVLERIILLQFDL